MIQKLRDAFYYISLEFSVAISWVCFQKTAIPEFELTITSTPKKDTMGQPQLNSTPMDAITPAKIYMPKNTVT